MQTNLVINSITLFVVILILSLGIFSCSSDTQTQEEVLNIKTPAELAAEAAVAAEAEKARLVAEQAATEAAEKEKQAAEAAAAKAAAEKLAAEAAAATAKRQRIEAERKRIEAEKLAAAKIAEAERRKREAEANRKRLERERKKNACQCPPRTFRSRSDHTWVEFRLPRGTNKLQIQIPGGAHNKYVFPKCNRVHWSDLTFRCDCGRWKKIKGDWDADAWCHGSKGNSPYVFVGEH